MKLEIQGSWNDIANVLEALEEHYRTHKGLGPGTKAESAKKIHNQIIEGDIELEAEFDKL